MKKATLLVTMLSFLVLVGCTQLAMSSPVKYEPKVMHYVPYVKADLDGELFKVTKHIEGAHEVDIVIVIKHDDYHVLRLTPSGEYINEFTYDWKWDHARLLPNGNYLLGVMNKRVVEVNPNGDIVWELDMPWLCHQTVPLPNNNLLVSLHRANGFMEVTREGEVVFEWYAKDYINSYDPTNYRGFERLDNSIANIHNPLTHKKTEPDWTHLNFAQKLPNGNYIASLRNLDLVVEVDGKSGEIVWSWGPGIIKHQHTPIVYDNYMYVFDNGNGRVIKVNRNTGRIVLEIKGILSPTFGDVRRLPNGNLLITDGWHHRAFEINEKTGKVVWEIQTHSLLYRVWAVGTW